MGITFPATLDAFTNPGASDLLSAGAVPHHTQHDNLNDCVAALEAKVGVDSSAVATSLDYLINHLVVAQVSGAVPNTRTVNGHALSANVTVTAADVGAPSGSGTSSGTNTGDQTSVSGNAGTATALQTARAINGVNFDGTAPITVAAAAGTLTGTTLAANVVTCSLTTFSVKVNMAAHYGAVTADADGATITFDCNVSDKHKVTLGGNRTLALSNDSDGQVFMVIITQDGTGTRTVSWWSGISWAAGSAPTLTTTASKRDVFSFIRMGSGDYLGFVVGQNL